jgi:hypothetical protein
MSLKDDAIRLMKIYSLELGAYEYINKLLFYVAAGRRITSMDEQDLDILLARCANSLADPKSWIKTLEGINNHCALMLAHADERLLKVRPDLRIVAST